MLAYPNPSSTAEYGNNAIGGVEEATMYKLGVLRAASVQVHC